MTTATQQFHFLIDDIDEGETARGHPSTLAVPEGISYLFVRQGTPQISTRRPRTRATVHTLEPIVRQGRRRLLLLTTDGCPPLINGQVALPAQLLELRDEVHFQDVLLHVTIFNRAYVGEPADAHLGKPCPVCTIPIERGRRVYVCSNCNTAFHAEGEEQPADTRLECLALIRECPACSHALAPPGSEGFLYEPER